MRKEDFTSSVASSNNSTHLHAQPETFIDQFVNWFRNFLENAE